MPSDFVFAPKVKCALLLMPHPSGLTILALTSTGFATACRANLEDGTTS
jgi:hypothetical protein